jgi:hypothetical protein
VTSTASDPTAKIPEFKVSAVRVKKAGEASEAKSA